MLAFKVALTNVPFDNDYRNNIRFNNRTEQENAFDIPNIFNNAISVNFNAGNLLTPTIYHRVVDSNALNDLLSYNYCVVENAQPNATLRYLYYFIVNSVQDSSNQIKLDLEMDLIQTYYMDLTFGDSFIFKAHLNRFVYDTASRVKFDTSPESKLYVREDIKNLAKRPVERKRLKFGFNQYDIPSEDLTEVLDSMVYCWVYIYCYQKDGGYKFWLRNTEADTISYTATTKFDIDDLQPFAYTNPYIVFCYPIYKNTTNKIRFNNTLDSTRPVVTISEDGFNKFLNENGGEVNIISIKLSILPPFIIGQYIKGSDWDIDSNGITFFKRIPSDNNSFKNLLFYLSDFSGDNQGLIGVYNQRIDGISVFSQDIDMSQYASGYGVEMSFNKSEIIDSDYNEKYNPKLLSYDFKHLSLTNDISNYDYDILKLGTENNILSVGYSEVLNPDITRGYARIIINGGVYNLTFNNNFRGLVFSQDNSQPYSVNNLESFMSQNKNFYTQRGLDASASYMSGITNTLVGIITNSPSGITGGLNSIYKTTTDLINSNLTLDNMRSAPEQVKNANGTALLNLGVNELALYLDLYSALPSEIKIAADSMNVYGFNYNQYDNIKNVDNIRKYFNYVRADVETITAPINISNKIHNKLRDIFRTGIRLWNWIDGKTFNNLFDYSKENYENWLEE